MLAAGWRPTVDTKWRGQRVGREMRGMETVRLDVAHLAHSFPARVAQDAGDPGSSESLRYAQEFVGRLGTKNSPSADFLSSLGELWFIIRLCTK